MTARPPEKPPSREIQYAVLCRRDGVVRDQSTPDPEVAARWAAERDHECGKCYPEHNPHIVVSRTVTAWTPVGNAPSRTVDDDR